MYNLFLGRNSIEFVRIIDDNFNEFRELQLYLKFGICEKITHSWMPLAIMCTVKSQIRLKPNFLQNICSRENFVKPAVFVKSTGLLCILVLFF